MLLQDVTAEDNAPSGRFAVWFTIAVLTAAFYCIEHRTFEPMGLEENRISGDEMSARALEGDLGRRLAIPAVGLLGGLLLMCARQGRIAERSTVLAWMLLAYLGWCMLSILWSIDRPLSSRNVGVLLLCCLGAVGIAARMSINDIWLIALAVTSILVLNSVRTELSAGLFQPWVAEYRFAGTLHPNVQAPYCAVMALSAACLASRARRGSLLLWAICLTGLGLLVLTKSRTVCASLLAGLLLYSLIGLSWQKKLLAGTGAAWCCCAAVAAGVFLGADVESQVVNAALIGREEDNESLSGRLPYWSELAPHIEEHALLGHGYRAFWDPERIATVSSSVQWTATDGHSAFLDTALDLGIIGLALFVFVVATGIREGARQYLTFHDAGYGFLFALLVCRALNACLESAFSTPTNFVSFITVCGLVHVGFYHTPQISGTERGLSQEVRS